MQQKFNESKEGTKSLQVGVSSTGNSLLGAAENLQSLAIEKFLHDVCACPREGEEIDGCYPAGAGGCEGRQ